MIDKLKRPQFPIEPGSEGDHVQVYQGLLFALGFATPAMIRGFYGPETLKGTKQLQSALNLEQTGILDLTLHHKLRRLGIDYLAMVELAQVHGAYFVSILPPDVKSPATLHQLQEDYRRRNRGARLLSMQDPRNKGKSLSLVQKGDGRFSYFRAARLGGHVRWREALRATPTQTENIKSELGKDGTLERGEGVAGYRGCNFLTVKKS